MKTNESLTWFSNTFPSFPSFRLCVSHLFPSFLRLYFPPLPFVFAVLSPSLHFFVSTNILFFPRLSLTPFISFLPSLASLPHSFHLPPSVLCVSSLFPSSPLFRYLHLFLIPFTSLSLLSPLLFRLCFFTSFTLPLCLYFLSVTFFLLSVPSSLPSSVFTSLPPSLHFSSLVPVFPPSVFLPWRLTPP